MIKNHFSLTTHTAFAPTSSTSAAFTGSTLHPEVFPAPGTREGPFIELYSLHSMPQLGTI